MKIRPLAYLAILVSTFLLASSSRAANDKTDVDVLRATRAAQLNDPYRSRMGFRSFRS